MTDTLQSRIARLREVRAKATQGIWEWWTSCSYRRLKASEEFGGRDVSVAHGYLCKDGTMDIDISEEDMAFIQLAANDALPVIDDLERENARLRDMLILILLLPKAMLLRIRLAQTKNMCTWQKKLSPPARSQSHDTSSSR